MNKFDEMRIAVAEAKRTINAADYASTEMARMLQGRLRNVSPYVLKNLKKELREFNAHTNQWKT